MSFSFLNMQNLFKSSLINNVLILFICFLLYGRTLPFDFVKIDDPWIVINSDYLRLVSWEGLYKVFFDLSFETRMRLGAEYLPLRDISAIFQYQFFGSQPMYYRFLQILIYAGGCVLLRSFLGSLKCSAFIQHASILFFIVFPLHVECIVWLSSHKDMLCFLMSAASLLFYSRANFSFALMALVMALLSKYYVIFLPFLFVWVDRLHHRQNHYGVYALAFIACASVLGIAQHVGTTVSYVHDSQTSPLVTQMLNILQHATHNLVLPIDTHLFYNLSSKLSAMQTLQAVSLLLLYLVAVWKGWQSRTLWGFSLFLILISLLPMIKASPQNMLADRYLLWASFGSCIILASIIERIKPGPRGAATTFLVIFYAGLTFKSQTSWSNTKDLWLNIRQNNGHPVAVSRALAYQAYADQDWATAQSEFRKFLALGTFESQAQFDKAQGALGVAELYTNNIDQAQSLLPKHASQYPCNLSFARHMGHLSIVKNLKSEAKRWWEKALECPQEPKELLHWSLFLVCMDLKDQTCAHLHFSTYALMRPNDPRVRIVKTKLFQHMHQK